ncbi:MAG: GNAT family N-acetyltransferase [Clostridia bacterium]|nr:GNAT family N-acetyltransferase [Clostridia bacterium]
MIIKGKKENLEAIKAYVSKDYARNYFIALGLLSEKTIFKDIYIEWEQEIKGILFHRTSGNLQYVSYEDHDNSELLALLQTLEFDLLISPKSFCKPLESILEVKKEGAIIAELKREEYSPVMVSEVKALQVEDLEDVISLYSKVFSGYPKLEVMKEKLITGRGIGKVIFENGLKSVAQSDFSKVIVGVATDPLSQKKGLGTRCLHGLIQELLLTETSLFLQYDNPSAGRIYEKLGFKPVDRVFHYQKR